MPLFLGANDMKQLALPVGWDASELTKFQLADGTTYDAIVNDIVAGLTGVGQRLLNHPIYGRLIYATDEQGKEYGNGDGQPEMVESVEYVTSEPRRADTIGHMWPLGTREFVLGWTEEYLEKARRQQVMVQIRRAVQAVQNTWEKKILTRFFSIAENTLGNSGKDVPFAAGGGIAFVPESINGQDFDATHTHFARVAATGEHANQLEAGVAHLYHHGIEGPYLAIVSDTDRAIYTALPKFIKPDRGVQYIQGASSDVLTVATMPDEVYFGMYETSYGLVRLYATPRLPTGWMGITKEYGLNNPSNALAVRYDPRRGIQPYLKRSDQSQFPLALAKIKQTYGVGINRRELGYAVKFSASGSYTSPTIR